MENPDSDTMPAGKLSFASYCQVRLELQVSYSAFLYTIQWGCWSALLEHAEGESLDFSFNFVDVGGGGTTGFPVLFG